MMRAISLTRYGTSGVLQPVELPPPTPAGNEVLVRVRATAVNDWDLALMEGKPLLYRLFMGLFRPKTRILGAEVAGEVVEVGPDAKRFRAGDAVYGDISEAGFGGFAEFVCVREDALAPKASRMGFEEAAALPHASMLAMQGLFDTGKLREGQRVLINGAGGGVGTMGIQLAKLHGAEVTGVDSAAKLELMRSAGADHVIDYREQDFTRNGQTYDLIVDAKTTRSPRAYLRALAPGGIYATVGGEVPRLLQLLVMGPALSRLTGKQLQIVALKPNKDLERINELFDAGKLKCAIDGPFPLSEVPQAVDRFRRADHLGKIVIVVAGQSASQDP